MRTAWWTKKLELVDASVGWSVEGVFRRSGVCVVVDGEEQLFGHSDAARFKVKYGFHGGSLEEVEARKLEKEKVSYLLPPPQAVLALTHQAVADD